METAAPSVLNPGGEPRLLYPAKRSVDGSGTLTLADAGLQKVGPSVGAGCSFPAPGWQHPCADTDMASSEPSCSSRGDNGPQAPRPLPHTRSPELRPAASGHRTPGRPYSFSIMLLLHPAAAHRQRPAVEGGCAPRRSLTRTLATGSAESPSPSQPGRGDEASPSVAPPSSGPLFPPPPALRFKPTQHGASPWGACVAPGAGRRLESPREFRGQRAWRGVRSPSLGGGGESPLSSFCVGWEGSRLHPGPMPPVIRATALLGHSAQWAGWTSWAVGGHCAVDLEALRVAGPFS